MRKPWYNRPSFKKKHEVCVRGEREREREMRRGKWVIGNSARNREKVGREEGMERDQQPK